LKIYPENLTEQIEFDIVKQQVAKLAVSSQARLQLQNLMPVSDFRAISEELLLVNEMLSIYQSGQHVPAIATADITEALSLLRIERAVLIPQQFLDIKELLDKYNHLYRFFENRQEQTPGITQVIAPFPPEKSVPEAIESKLEPNGQVRSNASPELSKIRGQLIRKRSAADRIFYRTLKKYSELNMLGDFRESVHENKRVLAIHAAYKGRVNGIFHGSSAKNSLFFVEPSEMIDINNEIAILEDEEQQEIRRILMALTAFIANFRHEISDRSALMIRLDFLHAKGRYAYQEDACLPRLESSPHMALIQAINPVLRHFNKSKNRPVVPLDLTLDHNHRLLVISGPNAGGKSLTLKTVGLLAAMLQSGLLVPVHPKSVMGIFDTLFGDIGDSQSIENELSTYSSKLEKMQHFLQWADNNTLLLIDEFGSGTDPDLGGAIAEVFLQKLNSYSAFGIITTHYNTIKALAAKLTGVVNGSMRFNRETFQPEYILQTGVPGSSYTFEVAIRSGIPEPIVAAARQRLDSRTTELDDLLVGMQEAKNQLAHEHATLRERLENLEQLKIQHEVQIKKLEEKVSRQSEVNETHSDQLRWGKRLHSLVNSYIRDRSAKNRKVLIGQFLSLLTESAATTEKQQKKNLLKKEQDKQDKLDALLSEPIKAGDQVKLIHSKQVGDVVEVRGDKFLVSFGILKTSVTRDKIILADRRV
jgi:DNA mismatch repair protein MutS2